ncbi:MAG: threonylcarbamoyl-AMP synthase [Candidatus Liptonbacteria bacterium]|nr:threonylcarbamoyl-AMP synthase [Candidatus Liptonbacteria bacterium]
MAVLANSLSDAGVVRVLRVGGVAVIPTDTIYGIVGSALREKTVVRIYKLRKRNPKKPLIVLIGSLRELSRVGVRLGALRRPLFRFLRGVWPGRVSVALPVKSKKFGYLHRGTGYIAFRVPAKKALRELLMKTGPLVAPSANVEGKSPATTLREAQRYFGDRADCYVDGGKVMRKPSTLVKILEGKPVVIRK